MRTIKVGVIGCGAAAEKIHLPAYKNCYGVKVLAIADAQEERASRLSQKFGVKKWYNNIDEFLQKEKNIEAVSVCLPTFLHKDAVIRAAEEKKQILCEKPLAVTLEEAREMINAVRNNGVMLYAGYQLRFVKTFKLFREYLRKGFVGIPLSIRVAEKTKLILRERNWYYDRKKGGGALFDLGSHAADLLCWTMGQAPNIASAHATWDKETPNIDIESRVNVLFGRKIEGVIEVSWKDEEILMSMKGSKGEISADAHNSTLALLKHDSIIARSKNGVIIEVYKGISPHQAEINEFVHSIREGKSSDLLASHLDGFRALELVTAAYGFLDKGNTKADAGGKDEQTGAIKG